MHEPLWTIGGEGKHRSDDGPPPPDEETMNKIMADLERGRAAGEPWALELDRLTEHWQKQERIADLHIAEPPAAVVKGDLEVEDWFDHHQQQRPPIEAGSPAYKTWHFIKETAVDVAENSRDLFALVDKLAELKTKGFDPDQPKQAGPMFALWADWSARGFQESLTVVERPHAVTIEQWLFETTIPDKARAALALKYYNHMRAKVRLPAAGKKQFNRDLAYAKGTLINFAKFGRLPKR